MPAHSSICWLHPARLRALAASCGLQAPPEAGRTLCIVARADDAFAASLAQPHTLVVTLGGYAPLHGLAAQTAGDGPFDFIVAHGVFASLERPERAALLAAAARLLAPAGLLAIDYPTQPGGHLRAMVWESVRSYAEAFEGPAEQVRAARQLLATLAAHLPCEQARGERRDVYAMVIRAEHARSTQMSDGALLHELSGEQPAPLHIHEVLADAHSAGLQLVGEALPEWGRPDALSPLDEALAARLAHGPADVELCRDLARGTLERQTVLRRAALRPAQHGPAANDEEWSA